MKIKEVGTRGVLFAYENYTSVYLIRGEKRLILCDTHFGPDSMQVVQEYLKEHGLADRELIIFNSHADYDHIWGNCAFPEATIIGHEECRKRMAEKGSFELELAPAESKYGEIELRLPTLTFQERMEFTDEEIELIYAPGHTVDSAICYDRRDSVLYVGDLLEDPLPYLLHHDLEVFIQSLEMIKEMAPKVIVSCHSGVVEPELIDRHLTYLRNILAGQAVRLGEDLLPLHDFNMKSVLFWRYMELAREKQGDQFAYPVFMEEFWGGLNFERAALGRLSQLLGSKPYAELEEALQAYVARL